MRASALRQSPINFVQQSKTKNWQAGSHVTYIFIALQCSAERNSGERQGLDHLGLGTTCRGLAAAAAAAAARFISVPGPVTALCDVLEFKVVRGQLRGFRCHQTQRGQH